MKLLRYAVLLVLGVNAWVLAQVVINRFVGEAEYFELTERELAMSAKYAHDASRSLYLRWQGNAAGGGYFGNRAVALSDASFNALGFSAEVCQSHRDTRTGYVLLVLDGEPYLTLLAAYRQKLAEAETLALSGREEDVNALERARRELISQEQGASRLIAVDAARTERELAEKAQQFVGRSLILPANLSPSDSCITKRVRVRLTGATSYHLSRAKARRLAISPSAVQYNKPMAKPRYRATLAVGSLGVPWVESVNRCDGDECYRQPGVR
ncbi:DUF4824 family protein [Gilvimarinus chinensis]|uniref:DUF4824 family protein n=1 Tax=Gilvimarinus chinensis TaxID=396005 RepID=UPI00037FBDF0|nr:DUF4824 family protein [Gilvimarinus chinensis]